MLLKYHIIDQNQNPIYNNINLRRNRLEKRIMIKVKEIWWIKAISWRSKSYREILELMNFLKTQSIVVEIILNRNRQHPCSIEVNRTVITCKNQLIWAILTSFPRRNQKLIKWPDSYRRHNLLKKGIRMKWKIQLFTKTIS